MSEQIKDLPGLQGIITNEWVNTGIRNGVNVRRKFKGLTTSVDINNNVIECIVYYFEQELYPDHTDEVPSISKTVNKSYSLKNIGSRIKVTSTPSEIEGEEDSTIEHEVRGPINTLNTYINELGQPGIINPVNSTLGDLVKLPLDVSDSYVLNSK